MRNKQVYVYTCKYALFKSRQKRLGRFYNRVVSRRLQEINQS